MFRLSYQNPRVASSPRPFQGLHTQSSFVHQHCHQLKLQDNILKKRKRSILLHGGGQFATAGQTILTRTEPLVTTESLSLPKMHRQPFVIVGAGLAGVLSAVMLANQGISVHVYERRPRPTMHDKSAVAYVLGLSARGILALEEAGFDLAALLGQFPKCRGFVRINPTGKGFMAIPFARPRSVLTDRMKLAAAMIDAAEKMHPQLIQFHFNSALENLNLDTKCASFKSVDLTTDQSQDVEYDVIIGADGYNSKVRQFAAEQDGDLQVTTLFAPPSGFTVLNNLPDVEGLPWRESEAIAKSFLSKQTIYPNDIIPTGPYHPENGWIMSFGVPNLTCGFWRQPSGTFSCVTFIKKEAAAQVETLVESCLARVPEAWRKALTTHLLTTKIANAGAIIRCSQLHARGGVVLVGDSGHAVTSVLGQGGNTALESSLHLGQLVGQILKETGSQKGETTHEHIDNHESISCPQVEVSFPFSAATQLGKEFSRTRARDVHAMQEMELMAAGGKQTLFGKLWAKAIISSSFIIIALQNRWPHLPFLLSMHNELSNPRRTMSRLLLHIQLQTAVVFLFLMSMATFSVVQAARVIVHILAL